MASPKQEAFIVKLLDQKDLTNFQAPNSIIELSIPDASKVIGDLLKLPDKARIQREAITRDGMYRNPITNTIYKVQYTRDKQRLYGKRLALDTAVHPAKVSFVYEPGILNQITADMRMTLEEAEEFGALYGTCMRCGRTLTNETSIALSIGPICRSYFE